MAWLLGVKNAVLEFVERNRYAPRELVLERLKRERDEAKALQRSGKFYQAFELYDHVDQEVSNLLMYAMRDVVNVEKSLNRGGKEFLDAGSELYSSSASGIATGLLQYIKHHLRLDGVVVATGGPPRPRLGYSARELAISKIEQAFEQPPNDVDYKWELDDEKSARLRLLEAYLHRVGSEWEGEEIRYAWMNIQQALALKPDSLAI